MILHVRLVVDVGAHADIVVWSTLTEGLCECVEHSIVECDDVLVVVELLGELCVMEEDLALTHDVVLEGIALELHADYRVFLHLLFTLAGITLWIVFLVIAGCMLETFSFNQLLLQEHLGYIRRESLQEFNTLLRVLPDVSDIVIPVVVDE